MAYALDDAMGGAWSAHVGRRNNAFDPRDDVALAYREVPILGSSCGPNSQVRCRLAVGTGELKELEVAHGITRHTRL